MTNQEYSLNTLSMGDDSWRYAEFPFPDNSEPEIYYQETTRMPDVLENNLSLDPGFYNDLVTMNRETFVY